MDDHEDGLISVSGSSAPGIQVTKAEYEAEKMTGAESALLDLLQAVLHNQYISDLLTYWLQF